MIITQAPVRVSFLGGGSDFPEHYERHGGAVLATAIDRFAYVTVQRFNQQFFDHGLRVAYRRTEAPRTAADIEHPAIRACLERLGIAEGVELHHMADLPSRTGLGSSSSFVVAMLQALHAFQGRPRTARALAEEAIAVEREQLQEAGGHQDQIIAAFGGTCLIEFDRARRFTVTPLPLPARRLADLQRHLLLLYTGLERDGVALQRERLGHVAANEAALRPAAAAGRARRGTADRRPVAAGVRAICCTRTGC